MLKILGVSDFAFLNSGIYTCLKRLVNNFDRKSYLLFTDQSINDFIKNDIFQIEFTDSDHILIFTHIEYSNLPKLLHTYKNATVFVCDWPPIYWLSVKKNQNYIKGILGIFRFYFRIRNLPRNNKYIFVAERDFIAAKSKGFYNSKFLPLGIQAPTKLIENNINVDVICFTGNFRYEPNFTAALELISFAKKFRVNLILAGFHANDLIKYPLPENIFIYDNVSSIVEFLVELRPIYISNIKYGAGAKNKIMEAIVAGCPIIATDQSLDSTLDNVKSIIKIKSINSLKEAMNKIKLNIDFFDVVTKQEALNLIRERSWHRISRELIKIVNE